MGIEDKEQAVSTSPAPATSLTYEPSSNDEDLKTKFQANLMLYQEQMHTWVKLHRDFAQGIEH